MTSALASWLRNEGWSSRSCVSARRTCSSVRDNLRNPKYTGYMVWNRRAAKKGGKVNSPEAWVWSVGRTNPRGHRHSRGVRCGDEHDRGAQAVTQRFGRERQTSGDQALLSAVVFHRLGALRLPDVRQGQSRRTPYYVCQPSVNWGSDAKRQFPGHSPSIWMREDHMLEGSWGSSTSECSALAEETCLSKTSLPRRRARAEARAADCGRSGAPSRSSSLSGSARP